MKKYTNKLFNLQGVLLGKTEIIEEKNEIILHVKSPRKFAKCPYCKKSTKKVHQNGNRLIKHGIVDFRIVVLKLFVRRFK
jgi:transposase